MQMSADSISISNFDPIGYFLKKKTKFSPLSFAITVFIADLLVDGFLGFYFNVFFSKSPNPGLLQDITALSTDFIANPTIAFLYIWVLGGTERLFQNLINSKVLVSENLFLEELEKYKRIYASKLIFIFATLAAILLTVNQVGAYMGWLPWKTFAGYLYLQPQMSFARIPFWFFSVYGLTFSIYNFGVTLIVLHKIFQYPQYLKLYLSHPDQCAGFGNIGRYIANAGFAIAPFSFWVFAAIFSEYSHSNLLEVWPVIFIILLYLILVPALFFWPTISVHQAMVKTKTAILLELSSKINSIYTDLLAGNKDAKKQLELMEINQKLYDKSLALPDWPFNFQNIQQYLIVIMTPFVPTIWAFIADLFLTNLIPYLRSLFP